MKICPMCHRKNCSEYMSKSCIDIVFKNNPDFGVKVLTQIIKLKNKRGSDC